jgi:hypothetical protein
MGNVRADNNGGNRYPNCRHLHNCPRLMLFWQVNNKPFKIKGLQIKRHFARLKLAKNGRSIQKKSLKQK